MVGNLTKYQTLDIGYRKETIDSERASGGIRINNQEIETGETLKLLGETTDNRLNISEPIKSACMKASQRFAVLMPVIKDSTESNRYEGQTPTIQGSHVTLPYILSPGALALL